ncbi:MAG: hypothetical protein HC828_09470 [Blastochloris sp.]|nr:hypothetical protein [Blastochloris sp.]
MSSRYWRAGAHNAVLLTGFLLLCSSIAAQPVWATTNTIRIEAEAYDRYEDRDADNLGDSSAYTAPGPDVYHCASSCSNAHKIGAFYGGEWLEFDVAVPDTATYAIAIRYGTRSTGAFATLIVDGTTVSDTQHLPATGHYDGSPTRNLLRCR